MRPTSCKFSPPIIDPHPHSASVLDQLQLTAAGAPDIEKKPVGATFQSTRPSINSLLREDKSFNLERIGSNALLSVASITPTFGLFGACTKIAMEHANPLVRIGGTFGPMVAGVGSSYISEGTQFIFDIRSSGADKKSLARDASTPVSLAVVNYAYMFSKLPKFPPNTRAGVLAALTSNAIGSAIGGATGEVIAQRLPETAPPRNNPTDNPPTASQIGIGRAMTQIPVVFLNQTAALYRANGSAVPARMSVLGPLFVSGPYIFRDSVTPRMAKQTLQNESGITK